MEPARALARETVDLVTVVEADGPDRCQVAQPEAHAPAQVGDGEVADLRVDVAHVQEGGELEGPREIVAQLRASEQERVAAGGEDLALRGDHLWPDAVDNPSPRSEGATREEPLGEGKQRRRVCPVGGRETEPDGEHESEIGSQTADVGSLDETLDVAHAPEGVEREPKVRREERSATRLEGIVPRVPHDRERRPGDRVRSELPVDLLLRDLDVEDVRVLEEIAIDERRAGVDFLASLDDATLAVEIEAGSVLLLKERGQERVEVLAEEPGLAHVEEKAIAAEAAAREDRRGPPEPVQVAPRQLHAAPQQVLLRVANSPGDRRSWRFLHAHDHVPLLLARRVELADRHPLEDAEAQEAPLTLEYSLEGEGLSRAEVDLASDGHLLGLAETGDHDALDDGAGPGLDDQAYAHLGPIVGEPVLRPDGHGEKAGTTPGGEKDLTARGHVPHPIGKTGPDRELLEILVLSRRRKRWAIDLDLDHRRLWPGPGEEHDRQCPASLGHIHLDRGLEVPAFLEPPRQRSRVLPENGVLDWLSGSGPEA